MSAFEHFFWAAGACPKMVFRSMPIYTPCVNRRRWRTDKEMRTHQPRKSRKQKTAPGQSRNKQLRGRVEIKKALLNCYARNRIMSSSIRLVWACQIYAESWCGVSSSLFLTKDRALIYPISIFMRKCSIRINDQGEMTLICRIAREEKERNFFPSLSAKKGAHET